MVRSVPPSIDFTVYGPLGLLTLMCVYGMIHVWRARERDREAHQAEMRAMVDRYVAHTETSSERYQTLARELYQLLESVERNRRPRG